MHTANLELSRELYELSGWDYQQFYWLDFHESKTVGNSELVYNTHKYKMEYGGNKFPAYDLGFLLRKLPHQLPHPATREEYTLGLTVIIDMEKWQADYVRSMLPRAEADTPENAVAKLAISLFKQGVLTREAL